MNDSWIMWKLGERFHKSVTPLLKSFYAFFSLGPSYMSLHHSEHSLRKYYQREKFVSSVTISLFNILASFYFFSASFKFRHQHTLQLVKPENTELGVYQALFLIHFCHFETMGKCF